MRYFPRVTGVSLLFSLVLTGCGLQLGMNGKQWLPSGPKAGQANSAAGAEKLVAVLVPLSGKGAGEGNALLKAVSLAQADMGSGLKVKGYDTKGDQGAAKIAAEQAVSEGAVVVLGPLFGKNIAPVSSVVGSKVPVLSFSNDSTKAIPSRAYIMGVTVQQELKRLFSYTAQQGKRTIAIAAGEGAYAETVIAAAQKEAQQNGLSVVSVTRYGSQVSKESAIQGLKSLSFDALLIAERGGALKELASYLDYNEITGSKAQFLGTSLWERSHPETETVLHGGWFPALSGIGWSAYMGKYQSRYGAVPTRLSAFGYDAMGLVVSVEKSGKTFSPSSFTSTPYRGIDGPINLQKNGLNMRDLVIKKVTPAGSIVIHSAGSQG